jgi:hypothetical protein
MATYALLADATNNYSYAVFTSVMAIDSSNLQDLDTLSPFHQVSGVLCTQEWERFCAFFCEVFDVRELRAQIYEDNISITTRSRPKEGTSPSGKIYLFIRLFKYNHSYI